MSSRSLRTVVQMLWEKSGFVRHEEQEDIDGVSDDKDKLLLDCLHRCDVASDPEVERVHRVVVVRQHDRAPHVLPPPGAATPA